MGGSENALGISNTLLSLSTGARLHSEAKVKLPHADTFRLCCPFFPNLVLHSGKAGVFGRSDELAFIACSRLIS